MKKCFLLPASILLTATIMVSPAISAEKDDILPPPTKVEDSEEARETVEGTNDSTDLNKELSAPEKLEEGAEVRSFTRRDGAEVTEYSVKGRVYMVRVKPAGNLPAYYLYDRDGDGVLEQRLPGGYKRPSPPMWVIKRF